ncbi:MAG: glycerate kinase type-2 family protein, partial [Candidatus Binatia bacterium]
LRNMRQDACKIFAAGLRAADPAEAIFRHVRRHANVLEIADHSYDLSKYRDLYVVGAGKGSAKMAGAVAKLLWDLISGTIVIVKYNYSLPIPNINIIEAGHPIPDLNGSSASAELIDLLKHTTQEDLVICLISGGASALLTSPAEDLSLGDKQETTRLLLSCGAQIYEMNAVRKHISKVKGGRLAKLAFPSTVISLILSDVIGDPIETIGSGPTAADPSTFADCRGIIEHYGLQKKMPLAVTRLLQKGARGELEETPKPSDPVFDRVQNVIIGNNRLALETAKRQAEALGYNAVVLTHLVEGEAAELAIAHAALAKQIVNTGKPLQRPACVISGGEATVTLRGNGLGGRNQEFALAAALEISGLESVVVLSGGTDGTDGPTNAAGGMIDGTTIKRGEDLDASDYLSRNDSYHFLNFTNDLLITGPTFTNIMDLRLILVA